jgi:hypothetical protein
MQAALHSCHYCKNTHQMHAPLQTRHRHAHQPIVSCCLGSPGTYARLDAFFLSDVGGIILACTREMHLLARHG